METNILIRNKKILKWGKTTPGFKILEILFWVPLLSFKIGDATYGDDIKKAFDFRILFPTTVSFVRNAYFVEGSLVIFGFGVSFSYQYDY